MFSPPLQPEHPETEVGGLQVQSQPGLIGHSSQKQSEGRGEKGEKKKPCIPDEEIWAEIILDVMHLRPDWNI